MNGLSEILRPKTFEEFIGQEHLLGKGALLRISIEQNQLFSAILAGPPGTGKSSVLQLIKSYTDYEIYQLNAAFTSVEEIKKLEHYAYNLRGIKKVLIFIDEIHRFNRKQQDVFLPGVETGVYVLYGTTTENPEHSINPALLSRCRVLRFKKLSNEDLLRILEKAINYLGIRVSESTQAYLINSANGDARFLLNTYELLSNIAKNQGKDIIDDVVLKTYFGEEYTKYSDTEHYNLASAFIKSIRGSDPDAALYYMMRMIEGGEDPRFIARRLVILASEDVGLADPFALVLAVATSQAVESVGLPECIINLSECVIYLSLAPKSNSSYEAVSKAQELAKKTMNIPVPRHLLNVEDSGYKYPHLYGGFVKQTYLPKQINDRIYIPKNIAKETKLAEVYKKLWKERFSSQESNVKDEEKGGK
ncbi:AAA ATPase [Fervidobacterium pennivorans DSM 9078]|uniref:AAA ATPase n=1 Tax=Fervidobacterium pennivorans (strain DSM 9078 / Ven5) TaxID=771875 RepID=H9UAI2_FERPD|nr:replication-associated recombination protein A [Fervidobacterium pennivorans]AFG34525.1 AAA ATPase [Fervidobacterium pennivorans DSM 9078]QIV77858.1 replication-associated recombination protein A [Fervidobacterium pennivorans subsp. keratinolyticus]